MNVGALHAVIDGQLLLRDRPPPGGLRKPRRGAVEGEDQQLIPSGGGVHHLKAVFFPKLWSESQAFCFWAPSMQTPDFPFAPASARQYSISARPQPFPLYAPAAHRQYR